jgi:hypothetical protein
MLRLAQIDTERLAELVTGARRMRAPAALARELGESSGRPNRSEAEHVTGPAYRRYRRHERALPVSGSMHIPACRTNSGQHPGPGRYGAACEHNL